MLKSRVHQGNFDKALLLVHVSGNNAECDTFTNQDIVNVIIATRKDHQQKRTWKKKNTLARQPETLVRHVICRAVPHCQYCHQQDTHSHDDRQYSQRIGRRRIKAIATQIVMKITFAMTHDHVEPSTDQMCQTLVHVFSNSSKLRGNPSQSIGIAVGFHINFVAPSIDSP
ncbi:hypothetical protein M8J77_010490 [Diaphorina citri]|nr:hypothetical protein M8J77_010490 [Diaphorina citri]